MIATRGSHRRTSPCGPTPLSSIAAALLLFAAAVPARAAEATAADFRAALRHDALALPVGFFLLGLGLAAGAVALARRRTADLTLLSFAGFVFLYGLRLLVDADLANVLFSLPAGVQEKLVDVLTYLMPLPVFRLLNELLGPGWRGSLRRIWQLQVVLAVIAIPWEIAAPVPGVLLGPYRWLVILGVVATLAHLFAPGMARRPDLRVLRVSFVVLALFVVLENLRGMGLTPWRDNLEPLGVLFFLCGLGVSAARHVQGSEERLAAIRRELETARRIQAATLPEQAPRLAGLDVAARYVPAEEVAGDFYDFLPGDGRRLGILVADVSGHGVPAALVAAMLKVAVAAQAAHAARPGRVLTEMNGIFHGKLRNQFITACCVHLDLEGGSLTYAGAGHPPPLLWRAAEGRVEELAQGGIVMGRLRRATYGEASVALAPGDRLLLYTDGIPEALNPAGEPFGDERLREVLASGAALPADAIADALVRRVQEWSGRSESLEDDLTLVVAAIEGGEGVAAATG